MPLNIGVWRRSNIRWSRQRWKVLITALLFLPHHPRRHTCHHHTGGHTFCNDSICSDVGILANGDPTDQNGTRTDVHAIPDGGAFFWAVR